MDLERRKKHAYLIMAHNNFYILDKLLRLLDDPRNDIYLHIDKKIKNFDFVGFRAICMKAVVYYPKKRINVQWGTQSQVLTEMLLFKTAYSNGPYQYYHLLSGVDLPLRTQEELQKFFDDKTESFLLCHETLTEYDRLRISIYRNLLGNRNSVTSYLSSLAEKAQMKMKLDRLKGRKLLIKRGWNWASLPQSAVEEILSQEKEIVKLTRFSVCADELYKQIVLLNSNCPIYRNLEGKTDCLRYVDWSTGGNHPHVLTMADYDTLLLSGKLFARKFDEAVDQEVVDKLFSYIMSQQKVEGDNENRNCNHF